MSFLTKFYGTFCGTMGLYGFTRGYRCDIETNKPILTSEKYFNGLINGLYYATPIFNMSPTRKLLNRLEIEYKNFNKNNYKDNYTEITGVCNDTI